MSKRIVVTGLGALTPLGNDVPTFWSNLLEGRNGAAPITSFDASMLQVQYAAELKDFDPAEIFDRRVARRNDLFTLYALEASRQAIVDAELVPQDGGHNVGVLIGTGIGGLLTLLENYEAFTSGGPRRVSAMMVPRMMPNAAGAAVAMTHGLRGPNFALASACATGSHAIGEAARMIRTSQVDAMVCGGSEAVVTPISIAAFVNMGAMSTNPDPERASRPFDAERDGFVLGEGAGILVIESLKHAQDRGARIYAELVGYGATADAFHITAPDEQGAGAAAAMRMALDEAGIAPSEVDYINAHGTSTQLNDPIETRAIHSVFGAHAKKLAVSSTKSMIGHLMGAAGAVEAVACIKSLETGWVHPTINYENPDPDCDLDYVPNEARQLDPQVVLSNSFGFGGHNGCVLFRRFEETG
jgi:3-oxoacyl-[acyl-carrier-protein] synthase II